MNESEKNEAIKKQLKEAYQNLENGRKRLILQAEKKIKEIWKILKFNGNEEDDDNKELYDLEFSQDIEINDCIETYEDKILPNLDIKNELEKLDEKYRYISFIRNSFSNDYFGYIDPESKSSLDDFIASISNLSTIDKNNLTFNGMTSERNYFNHFFEAEIAKEIDYMKTIEFIVKYNTNRITSIADQMQREIQRNEHFLTNINDIPDEIFGETHKEIIKELVHLEKEKGTKEKQLLHFIDSLNNFKNAPVEPFWKDSWNIEPGLLWWRNHLCKYDNDTHYEKVEENLDTYTKR